MSLDQGIQGLQSTQCLWNALRYSALGYYLHFSSFLPKTIFAVIFTESKEMQEAVSRLAFLLGITMIINSVHPVILGKPNWNILSYCKCKTTRLISSKVIIYVSITFSIGHLIVDPWSFSIGQNRNILSRNFKWNVIYMSHNH